jgi:hypothetical protein
MPGFIDQGDLAESVRFRKTELALDKRIQVVVRTISYLARLALADDEFSNHGSFFVQRGDVMQLNNFAAIKILVVFSFISSHFVPVI